MIVRVKGFKIFKDRYGKERCYHRATGTAVNLERFKLGSVEFFSECGRIAAKIKEMTPKPGTLELLIAEYKKSPAWKDLKPKTQEWYNIGFTYLERINDAPLTKFTAGWTFRLLDKAKAAKGWYIANIVRTAIVTVFTWGIPREYVTINPAADIKKFKRPKDLVRANRPWTEHERDTVMERATIHFKAVLGMMLYTGADPCDAIALSKTRFNGESIDFSRQKTGNAVHKVMPQVLKAILNAAPDHEAATLLANSYGNPWTKSGVDSVWFKLKGKLEEEKLIEKGLTLKGLRHTHATMLREMGESHQDVADALGDKSMSMGLHYSRDADIKSTMERQTKAFDEKHKVVKLLKKGVKP